MPSKLSFHLSAYPPGIYDQLGKMRPAVVKVFNQSSEMNIRAILNACSPQPYIVYRHFSPHNDYREPAQIFFNGLADTLRKFQKEKLPALIWEGINEPIVNSEADALALNKWYMEFAKLMHDAGQKVAGFSWSTGNPGPEKYGWLLPKIVEAARAVDVHAFHEYFHSPKHQKPGDYGALGLYHKFEAALPPDARRPVIITEAGIDDGGNSNDGYNGKISPVEYLDSLRKYDAMLLGDHQVLGFTIYQCGDPNWSSFEITPMLEALADYVKNAGGGPVKSKLWVAAAPQRGRRRVARAAWKEAMPLRAGLQPKPVKRGVNINPAKPPACRPTVAELRQLGATWVRFVFDAETVAKTAGSHDSLEATISFYEGYVTELSTAGINILMVLNNQTLPHWTYKHDGHWDEYLTRFATCSTQIAERYKERVRAYQIWNEPDFLAPSEQYDPTLPPEVFWGLLHSSYAAIKSVSPDIKVVAGGLASGQPGWLDGVKHGADRTIYADAVAVHPYGRRPTPTWPNGTWGFGVLGDLVREYSAKVKPKPIWITEIGTDDTDNQRDFPAQVYKALDEKNLAGIAPIAFWFCWSDDMVPPFGLVDRSGKTKGSYTSFQAVAAV